MSIKSLLFPTRQLCYLCKEKTPYLKSFTCTQCYEKLDFVYKEVEIDSLYIDRVFYALTYNRYLRELMHDFKFNEELFV